MSLVVSLMRWRMRGGTASNLSTVDEVPLERELQIETDTLKLKLGDGTTAWSLLPYIGTDSIPEGSANKYFTNDRAYLALKDQLVQGSNVTLTANDTTKKITISVAGGGGGGYAEGSVNPGSPSLNDKFYRTDLNLLIYYDGTRWLTVQEFSADYSNVATVSSSPASAGRYVMHNSLQVFVTTLDATVYVNGTNNGSNYWTFEALWVDSANVPTSIDSMNTSAFSGSTWNRIDMTINAAIPDDAININVIGTKTGSPAAMLFNSTLRYRLIVP